MPTILGTSKQGIPLVQCKSCSREFEWASENFPWGGMEDHPFHEFCDFCDRRNDLEFIDGLILPKPGFKVESHTLMLLQDPGIPNRCCKDCGVFYPHILEYFTWRIKDKLGDKKPHVYCLRCHNEVRKDFKAFGRKLKNHMSEQEFAKFPSTDEGIRCYWIENPHLHPGRFEPKVARDASTRGLLDA